MSSPGKSTKFSSYTCIDHITTKSMRQKWHDTRTAFQRGSSFPPQISRPAAEQRTGVLSLCAHVSRNTTPSLSCLQGTRGSPLCEHRLGCPVTVPAVPRDPSGRQSRGQEWRCEVGKMGGGQWCSKFCSSKLVLIGNKLNSFSLGEAWLAHDSDW